MPQAVSLFPSPPPQSNSAAFNQSTNDLTSSRFDQVLNDVRMKEPADATPSTTAPKVTSQKSSKPAKEKAANDSSAKAVDPKSAGKVKIAPSAPTGDAPEEDVPAPPGATAPVVETPQPAGKPKVKTSIKAEKSEPAPAVEPNAIQPSVSPVKNAVDSPQRDPESKANDQLATEVSAKQAIGADAQEPGSPSASKVESTEPDSQPAATAPSKSARLKSDPTEDQATQGFAGVQPNTAAAPTGIAPTANAGSTSSSSDNVAASTPIEAAPAEAKTPAPQPIAHHGFTEILGLAQGPAPAAPSSGTQPAHAAAAPQRLAPDAQFADANHPAIVTNIHGTLLPNGGSMQIRLNPPDLGAMDISVQMRNGTMTATFDTSNDQASRMLSHSLGQLKTALEAQGVTVGGLHVQQSPRNSETNSNSSQDDGKNQGNTNDASAQQQEQQRKDMLRRMWAKLSGDEDPLDLVA